MLCVCEQNFGEATPTGARLAVFGARYGHLDEDGGVVYTAADCIVTASHAQIVCLTVEGVGYGYSWEVSVGGQTSTVFLPLFAGHATNPRFRGTSYAAPIVSYVRMRGRSRLVAGGGGALEEGHTAAESTHVSPTRVCWYLPAVCVGCSYFDTDGGPSAPKDVTSYKTSGNQWVLIHGLNLGSNPNDIDSVEYQMPGTDAPFQVDPGRCSIPEAHRLLRCPTVQGAGQNLEWRIVIARQVSRNPVTGYHRPTVTTVSAVTGATVNALRTDGGEWITITGSGFGPVNGSQVGAPFVQRVRYGRTGTEYEATDVTVLGHDTVSVKTVPGVGQNLRVIVTVATQDSPVSAATLSYVCGGGGYVCECVRACAWCMCHAGASANLRSTVQTMRATPGMPAPPSRLLRLPPRRRTATLLHPRSSPSPVTISGSWTRSPM